MTNPSPGMMAEPINRLIAALDSMVDGDRAAEQLVVIGRQAIPYLERFLLDSPPRSLSLPRCRAVRALGELGAYSVLVAYLQRYTRPADATVLFAEDAVLSAAAGELMRSKSAATFATLLGAAKQRATSGLVRALGEFRNAESVPLLFELLEDDLCREDAKDALRQVPDTARSYAILLLRGCTDAVIDGPSASRRRRATLQLLDEFGVEENEWPELRRFLRNEDADCVVAAARLGLRVAPRSEQTAIVETLIEASARMNWAQEMETVELLDRYSGVARPVALEIAMHRTDNGETPNWQSPFWRTLHHILGGDLAARHNSA